MKTWTIEGFKGHYPVGTSAVVTADNIDMAIAMLEDELSRAGLTQDITPEQLVPMPTSSRKVRILNDGNY